MNINIHILCGMLPTLNKPNQVLHVRNDYKSPDYLLRSIAFEKSQNAIFGHICGMDFSLIKLGGCWWSCFELMSNNANYFQLLSSSITFTYSELIMVLVPRIIIIILNRDKHDNLLIKKLWRPLIIIANMSTGAVIVINLD